MSRSLSLFAIPISPRIPGLPCVAVTAILYLVLASEGFAQTATESYRSPWDTTYLPNGSIAVSDATASEIVVLAASGGAVQKSIKLNGEPRGLAVANGNLLVAEYNAGTIAVVDPMSGQVVKRLNVGPKPVALGVSNKLVAVTDFGLGKVFVINQQTGAQVGSVAVADYPFAMDVTGNMAVIGHLTPTGDASKPDFATSVSLVGLDPPKLIKAIALPQGSTGVRGIKCTQDGKWAYVAHLLGRTTLPTTHVLRGWINSNALSIIDLTNNTVYATVLLDRISEGAADPWGIAISEAGTKKTLWVTISGAHQVIRVDLTLLHELMAGRIPSELVKTGSDGKLPTVFDRDKTRRYTRPLSDIWFDIARTPAKRALLQDDLGALWGAGILTITRLAPAEGPRGIALSPDGKQLAVALYFAGKVALVNTDSGKFSLVPVGTQPAETQVRQGERAFYDASSTLQHWLSCNTCHPEARADGLNWDLLNDGAGNPKNSKSMVYSVFTPPVMAHGIRASAEVAILAGFKNIKFVLPSKEQQEVVGKYLDSLKAEVDPYRIHGEMTDEAKKGRAVFIKAGCDECHSGTYFTNLKMYDVGTKNLSDSGGEFDTPTLFEMWRTAPYLHDGSAATMKDVLTTSNRSQKHGKTSGLSEDEIAQLAAYVLQLGPGEPMPERDGGVGGAGGSTSLPESQGGTAGTSSTGTAGAGGTIPPNPIVPRAASAGCACSLGARTTRTAPVALGLLGLALLFRGRRRLKAALAGLLALSTLVAAHQTAQAASIDLKDPQFASLDKILVLKRPASSFEHIVYQYFGHQASSGGLFILDNVLSGGVTERDVLAKATCKNCSIASKSFQGGRFLSPDLSYDAKEVLFAYTDQGAKFHIFKVNLDNSEVVQLTKGDYDDFDPVWLPDGRIMFVSTRRGGYGRCHTMTMPTYTLFAMNADGTDIHAVSLHETNEWNPSVDNNGMVIYSRWDYVDRGSAYVHHGWITTPDGLDPRAIGTNYPPVTSDKKNILLVPNALLQLRSIPNSNKYVGTAVAHHAQSYGSLVVVDPDVEDDDGMAQYTRLTPDAGFPETLDIKATDEHKYATPWALSEDYFLCVADPSGKRNFGVYLIDRAGNKTLIKAASSGSYLDPIPLAPRPKPVVVVPSIGTNKTADVTVTVTNVYDSIYPWPDKSEIKELRIVQIYPKTTIVANDPRLGHGGIDANEQNGRGVLGTVPVESDGSANFLLPPGKPVYFQALDKDGVAIQSMMSDTYAVPGSTRLSCQGCHEPRHRTAHPGKSMPIALLRSPTPIKAEAKEANPMSYARLIQPILDKHCVSCHTTTPPILTKGLNTRWKWFTSYDSLMPYLSFYLSDQKDVPHPTPFSRKAQIMPTVGIPGAINGARASKLYPLLEGKHKGVTLEPRELRNFALWLDNNSDFFSQSYDLDGQRAGNEVLPKLE